MWRNVLLPWTTFLQSSALVSCCSDTSCDIPKLPFAAQIQEWEDDKKGKKNVTWCALCHPPTTLGRCPFGHPLGTPCHHAHLKRSCPLGHILFSWSITLQVHKVLSFQHSPDQNELHVNGFGLDICQDLTSGWVSSKGMAISGRPNTDTNQWWRLRYWESPIYAANVKHELGFIKTHGRMDPMLMWKIK